jgi:hypothetical protein
MSLELKYESVRVVWWCVHLGAPPHIYRCGKGSSGCANCRSSFELTLGTNGELPRWRSKAVELVLVRPNQVEPRLASTLDRWLTSGPPSPWLVNWCCPKLVPCAGGPLWHGMVRSDWSMLSHLGSYLLFSCIFISNSPAHIFWPALVEFIR